MKSFFEFYSKGLVAEDFVLTGNSKGMLKVFPEEHHTTMSEDLGDGDSENVIGNTVDNKYSGGKITKTSNLEARWLNLNDSNRVTPPFVKKGEAIMIFTFGESDLYFWTTMFVELDLRKRETILYMYGNQETFGEESNLNNSYWQLIDTIGKKVIFHTSNNDGEACGYDFTLDTKEGTYLLEDTIGNRFFLESTKKTLTIDLKVLNLNIETININGKTVNVKGTDLNIKESSVDINSGSTKVGGGSMDIDSTLAVKKPSDFTAPVKMNGMAKTSVGPHGHTHIIV